MFTIKMTQTAMGCQDGHTVQEYKEGEIYIVSQGLGIEFFKNKQAVRIK